MAHFALDLLAKAAHVRSMHQSYLSFSFMVFER